MRKRLLGLLAFFALVPLVVAGCLPGNGHPVFELEDGSLLIVTDWCCTPVGDGSELSCTDGEVWFNL